MRRIKTLIGIILLLVVIVAGVFGTATDTKDGKIPADNGNPVADSASEMDAKADEVSTPGDTIVQETVSPEEKYELDEETEQKIDEIIDSMSVREKVGQLFFIKNDGRYDESILEEYPVGGIILFSGDFKGETSESLTEEIALFQESSRYPLLVGTDEEGGTVIRVSNYSNLAEYPFSSPRSLYDSGGYDAIIEDTRVKSRLLLSYGINVNFAPVCDVSVNYGDFMYSRSFGSSAEEAAEYVSIVVETMNEENIGSVLKHFPGYGNNGDTHKSIIYDKRSYEQFQTIDFIPFKAGIEAGTECILVCHNIVECMDAEWPASLSKDVHEILRDELGFYGVIITDDLMMNGVSTYVSDEESAVLAIQAGNDMILSTNYQVQFEAVIQAVEDGDITEERLDESIRRILRWKYKLGLFE